MKIKCDLHIHSCLSACADSDMTICNIVNMSAILGTQVIAIADHNSSLNCAAAYQYARSQGILLIPAVEVSTAEDIHVLCLFRSLEAVNLLTSKLNIPKIPINKKFYNEQIILDSADNIIGTVPDLLGVATDINITALFELVRNIGGVAIPAHIDRQANSIIGILGAIPEELNVTTIELSNQADPEMFKEYIQNYNSIYGSDAHSLETLALSQHLIDVEELSVSAILSLFRLPKVKF